MLKAQDYWAGIGDGSIASIVVLVFVMAIIVLTVSLLANVAVVGLLVLGQVTAMFFTIEVSRVVRRWR